MATYNPGHLPNIEVTGAMADMARACTAHVVGNWKHARAQVACHLAAAERAQRVSTA
jgi:hypothetical protein